MVAFNVFSRPESVTITVGGSELEIRSFTSRVWPARGVDCSRAILQPWRKPWWESGVTVAQA